MYKLSVWQARIFILLTTLFMVVSIIWLIFPVYSERLEPLTIFLGGAATLTNFIYPKPNYKNRRLEGRDYFDYSSNNGEFKIGNGEFTFTTMWTKCSDSCIYLYNDPNDIDKIAIAKNVYNFSDIRNPSVFDYSSRSITLYENEIAVIINKNGYYALVKVIDVKDNSRDDNRDELTIEWVINPDKKKDFS